MKCLFTQLAVLLTYTLFKTNYVSSTKCLQYNHTLCNKPDPNECTTQKDCLQEQCYVVWSNISNVIDVKFRGCFKSTFECSQDECTDVHAKRADSIQFCCCWKDYCNTNHNWKPTPPPPTVKPSVTDDNQITVTCLVYVVFPLSMVLLVLLMLLVKKRKKFSYFNQLPTIEQHPPSPPTPVQEKLRTIQLIEVKARGKFGAVWKATDNNETVAVKIMPIQEKQAWFTEQEIYKLPLMKHENILHFICAEKRGDNLNTEFWLVTAYHPIGSVQEFLKSNTISWEQLCNIAYTMTKGLNYLHEEIPSDKLDQYKPAVAHRDIKSSNILLKSDLTACIADFGLAVSFKPQRACGDTHGPVGTRRYMAPEILEGAINFSRDAFLRIDMYACGLVLWELISRCTAQQGPVPDYKLPFEAEIGQHPTIEDIQDIVVHQKRRPVIKNTWRQHSGLNSLCDTIEDCWDHDAEARLNASCVMERIFWCSKSAVSSTTSLLHNDSTAISVSNNVNGDVINNYTTASDAIF